MSSVAVLTPESFAEHRSGLRDEESRGGVPEDEAYIPTYLEAFPPLPEKGAPGERSSEFTGVWNKIRPIKSSVITQVFHVPLEERRYKDNSQFGEGDEAKVCVDIMQKTGAHIELSLAKDQGLSIMVTGKLDSVMKARKEIVARLQTQASATVTIPKEHHRFVIGKNGEKLQELELKTATKINIPRPEDPSSQIKITGTKEGIEKARHEILLISAEQDKRAVERLNLEKVFHPFIAGAFNKTVQEIMQETGARINIPPPSVSKDEIIITGEKEPVSQALLRIRKIYEDKKRKTTTISVEVKKSQHKYIIGPKGNTLQEILDTTGVSVEMPPLESSSETIILRGEPDKLGPALTQVYAKAKSVMVAEVMAPAWLHRFIIGKKGQNIGRITQQLPKVHIEFTDGDEKITLEGPTEEVERAKRQLLHLAEEKQINNHSVELHAKPDYHKFLIGRGGANIRKVRDRTGARIIFPTPEDKDQDIITIMGKEDAVRQAQQELESLIHNLDNVIEDSMVVDPKYHRHFVARRGHVLREIAEEYGGVTVSFPRTGVQSDHVTLKGAKDCVEAAKKRILEIIGDLEAQVVLECIIPQCYHRVVMGAKGYKVQQITRDHNVFIKFPERDDNSGSEAQSQENGDMIPELDTSPRKCDIILISGRKEKCEAARAALLALVPITMDVDVPFDLHRYIIRQKGAGIRKMMEEYEVTISVPQPEQQSDIIKVTGLVPNVERAKAGLLDRVRELQAEQEDRALRGFKLTVSVESKYHPKIIGKKGAVISQIRKDHDVTVQFPDRGDEHQELITITGYEKNTEAARDAILKIVADLEEMVSEDVRLDHRVHARIIGGRGKAIRKLMEEFRVDIRFPQPGASDPDRVTVTGLPENVDDAIDHMLNLEEEYMMDVVETETMAAYMKPPSRLEEEPRGPAKGFVVRDAPWNASGNKAPDVSSAEEFPIFGTGVVPKQASVWGPKKF
ncbi:vigilin-like [Notechis scutatus]|uniref:Vigilin-like n=1 Tax=Notechis scutatus TaxID=8663 RepID=A0A6J1VGL3_9SAUR|nr:vigilin-like [Notechis scutatus]